jgi:hypothetical protein
MSWPEGGRVFADHLSATSQAGGQADQSHEVRHAARHRHRPYIQRLQAGRVTQENSSLIGTRVGSRPLITPRRQRWARFIHTRSVPPPALGVFTATGGKSVHLKEIRGTQYRLEVP